MWCGNSSDKTKISTQGQTKALDGAPGGLTPTANTSVAATRLWPPHYNHAHGKRSLPLVDEPDLDRSLRFYVDQLGFELIADKRTTSDGVGWIEVAPADGSADLALVAPKPDSPEYKLIGGYRWVLFMTEDVHAKYKEWSERGVHFVSPPENAAWGGTYARFQDPDGNEFGLEGFDEVRRSLELRRQEHAERVEAQRRAAHELEIA